MLVVGRIINGLSVGICSAQVPVYITELAPPSQRGRLVGFQQWAITWGILIMFFICYGCSYIQGTAAFRIPWGVQMVPAILLFLGLCVLPESPRWLAKNDRWEETKEVLALVHAKGDMESPWVQREMEEIREAVEFERANKDVTYMELFDANMLNRTTIGIFTQIWSQLTGMNVMMYYITYVFTMAGLADDTPEGVLLPSGINFIINVVMTVPALLWMDRWGRRPTLLIGAFFMCLWLCVNAGLFAVYSTPMEGNHNAAVSMRVRGAPAKAIIASTYLFVASFAPTWGPVSWTYPPELFPLRLRGKAVALTTSSNWAFNFALAYFVPPAFANIKWRTYVIFAVFCAAMFIHVFFFFPETANKPLEEIEEMFDGTKPGGKSSVLPLPLPNETFAHLNLPLQPSNTLVLPPGRPETSAIVPSSRNAMTPPLRQRAVLARTKRRPAPAYRSLTITAVMLGYIPVRCRIKHNEPGSGLALLHNI